MFSGENRKGSSWSFCLTAFCCSLRTLCATSRRSTSSRQYSFCGVISAGVGCNCSWSGSCSSRLNIIKLAVLPVTKCGVSRNVLIIWGSSCSHFYCLQRSSNVRKESPRLQFIHYTIPLDCGIVECLVGLVYSPQGTSLLYELALKLNSLIRV